MKQVDISFKDQSFFIGLDIHKSKWSVTIRSNSLELKTYSMSPDPEGLAAYLKKNYPGGRYISVYEAGYFGFWIHHALLSHGVENSVVHPSDVPTKNKETVGKRDPVDSRKLARELENGSLEGIYIPDSDAEQLRSFCRLRYQCTKHTTRIKNQIKGHLSYYGHSIPDHFSRHHWSGQFINWLESLSSEGGPAADCLSLSVDELNYQRARLVKITRQLRFYAKNSDFADTIGYLCSIPGIGFISAITLCSEIIDMQRFRTQDHLNSFVGLVPSCRSSGDHEYNQGLTVRRNKYLRHLIIESAWVAVRKDPALLESYNKLTKRMKKQEAIIRIARKLLSRIRYVWLNQINYKYCVNQ